MGGLQNGRLSLVLSQSLQTVLSDETQGGNFGGNWCRRGLWGYLCAPKGAFGGVPEHGWKVGLEQFLHPALWTLELGSLFGEGTCIVGC